MKIRILKDRIELPEPKNLTWSFPVEVGDPSGTHKTIRMKVDTSDLRRWVKEAIGRYPDSSVGDQKQFQDILANWDAIEPVLKKHLLSRLML